MVGKNNFKLRREKMGNKFYRYSIKRLSIGVASVAVSAGFLFAGREAVNVKAAEVSDENQALSQELDPDQNPALSEGSGVEDQETWEIPSKFGTELPDLDEELLEGIDDDQELLQEVEGQSPEEAPEEAKGHEEESQDIETEDDSDHTPSQNELDQNELEETLTEDPDEDDPEEDQADQNDQEGQVDEAGQWEEDQTDQDDNREGQNREDLGQPDQEAVTRPDLDGDKTDESKPADHSGDSSEEGSVKPELSLRNYIDPEGKSLTEIITDGFVKATLDDQELDIVRQDGHLLLNQPLQTNGRLQLEAINAAGVTNRRDFDLKEDGTLNPIKLVENKLENGRLQDSTADSSSQYSNRAANPQPTAGTTRSANTLSRAANDNLSPQSGRDVSNEVIVEGNLQVPTDSYTVARFLGIPIKKTGNYIQPTSGDSIYFTLSVQVPETVTSGDYIDLHYAPEIAIGQVDVNARTGLSFRERRLHEQIYGTPRPTITDGNGDIIAYIEDDRENNIIRYTFTDYVDRKSNVRFSHTLNHWIDLGEAQNTGEYPLYYRIGDEVFREDTFIDYRQNVRRNGPASTSSVINWVDDKTNTFRATAYFNIDNNYIGTEGRVFYITATEGTEPGAPNAINMDSLDIRVYRVSDGRVLPESRAFDPVAVGAEDITDQVNVESYLTSDNATEDGDYWIDAPTNNSDTYIMVVHGTFDPDRLGPQGEFGMQVQSNDVDYETGQQAGHTSYLVYSVEALSGEGNNIIEGGGEDKEEEKGPLFEMTVEDTGYGTKFVESDRPGWTGIREVRPGQNGRVRVLYVHVNPDQIPGFTPDDFVNIRGQYYQEVSREVIQESEDQIVEYSLPRIVNSIRRPDGSIEFIYNDGHTFTVPPAPTPQTLVPVVETDRGQGPSNPSDDNIRSYLTDNYNGDTRLGTWVTIKNPTGNYTITGEPEFIESYRFIPDGANGERGKDGRSVTIDLVDGEVEGREGTWVFVYQLDLEGNQGELIDSEFIPDGQDGHKVVIENRTPQGFDVVILDGEGQELDRETVSHGAKGDPGEDGINPVILTARGQGPADPSYALEVINEPGKYNGPYVSGLWITIYSPIGRTSTGEPRYREDVRFIPDGQNGENGRDGLTPRVRLEDGSDALDNSGKWVIVEYPVIDPTTGELVVDPVNNEPVYSEIQREFIQDGEDGLTPRVTVESGFDSDGNAGSWIIVESPLTNPITGEVTYEETNRTFVKDGQDGDDGEDGADGKDGNYVRVVDNGNGTYTIITHDGATDTPISSVTVRDGQSITASTQPGELGGRTGVWIIIKDRNTGAELDRTFVANGEDGQSITANVESGVVNERPGTWVIIRDRETGQELDRNFIYDGQSIIASVEPGTLGDRPGTWVIIKDRHTGDEIDRNFIYNGQNGEDGQSITANVEPGVFNGRPGTWVIIRDRDTNQEIDRNFIFDGQNGKDGNYVQVVENDDGTYTIITLDGETDEPINSVVVHDGDKGEPGRDGNYVELVANDDGTYTIINRDGETHEELSRATIRDGENGKDGNYVQVIDNGDGSYTIFTRDGENDALINSVTVSDGEKGEKGDKGDPGRDGRSITAQVERGEQNGRPGTWINIYEVNPVGSLGSLIDREFVFDGKDGQAPTIRTEPIKDRDGNELGIQVIVTGPNGEHISTDTIFHGRDGQDGDSVKVRDNQDGSYTIIAVGGDGSEEVVGTIRNGKDGEKGEKGDKGDKGEPGRDGQDGSNAGNIIIDNTNINTNENGDIVITIEGQDPVVIPNPDKLANPIQNMRIDDQGNLIVELTDGRTINAGYARGPQGEPGKDGKSPIISTREVSEGIEITVTNPDGSQHSHIVRHGEDGQAARIISTFKDEHGNTRLIFNDGTEVVISGYENGEKDPNTGDIINVNLTINVVKEGSTDQPSRVLTQANIDNRGHLILTYSNGETEDLGKVTASTDRTVVTALVNSDNELILVYSDGSTQNAGQIDIKEGPRGKSAYELWLEAGNTGSLQDFLDSLKGEDGQDGKDAEVGKVVQSVDINLDGDLVINYTDNSQQIIHNYPSSQDPSANGIKDARVDANGDLIITLDDGSQINAGNVRGPQGEPGADGRGIANIRIENNNLVVVYTDFSVDIIGQLTPSQPGDNQPGETPGQEEPGGSDGDTDKPDDKPGQDKPSEPGDGTGQPDDKPGQEDPGEPDSDPEEPGKPNGDQPDDDEPGQTPGDGSDDTGDKPGTDQPGETPGQSDGDNTDEPGQDKPGLPDGDNTNKPGQPGDDQSGQIPGDGSDNSGDKPGESDDVPVAPGQPGDDTDQSGNDDPGQTQGDGSDDTGDKPGTDQPGETPDQSDGDNTDEPGQDKPGLPDGDQPDVDTDKPGQPDADQPGESDGDTDKPGTSPEVPEQPGQTPGETDQPGDQPAAQSSQPTDGQDQTKPVSGSDRNQSDEELTYTRSGFPGTQGSKDFSFVQDPEDATPSDNLTKDEGQRLPDTASLTWVLGLIGASSLMGGSALALKDRKRK